MRHTLVLGAALAAALGCAMPSSAAISAADRLPPASAVAQFYSARSESLWLRSPDASAALLDVLRAAPVDGFVQGPDLAGSIEAALRDAEAGVPGAGEEAEKLMSSAFVLYAQSLAWPGTARMIFADPALAPRVPSAIAVLDRAAAAPELAAHVRQVAAVNPIHAALRDAAKRDMGFLGQPSRAMRASLDRARLLPATGRFVLVDIASQQLMMMEDGREVGRMKVVVGKPAMKTPLMAGTLRQVTFNPYWNVPVDLAASNIAPNVLRLGTGWFQGRGYEVLSGWDEGARVLDPASVDWKAVAEGRLEARVRQRPGNSNMMGDMKFQFPNDQGIYLHDTPGRELFGEAERAFSSGCVRLHDAAALGRWLLGREPVPSSDRPEYQVRLPEPVPVFLTYLTVRPEADGSLAYAPDIYGLDGVEEGAKVAAR